MQENWRRFVESGVGEYEHEYEHEYEREYECERKGIGMLCLWKTLCFVLFCLEEINGIVTTVW